MPGASSFNNFFAMAGVPCSTEPSMEAAGMCLTNIDGQCIRGGTRVAGTSGYALASLGFPGGRCDSFPMFAAGNQRYTPTGWDATSNANPLRLSRPLL